MIEAGTKVIAGDPVTQSRYFAELLEPCELSSLYKDRLPCRVLKVLVYPLQVDSLQGKLFATQRPLRYREKAKLLVYSIALPKVAESLEGVSYQASLLQALSALLKRIEIRREKAELAKAALLRHKKEIEGQDV